MLHFNYKGGELHCEDVSAGELAGEYGTPLYVYSKAAILEQFALVRDAFSAVPTTVCFSVKSCSSLAVLQTLQAAGSGFDIVSGGELTRVLKAGGDPRKVVFAGVGKTDDEIAHALDKDILMFNVESEAELDAIQNIAAGKGMVAPVSLRLNPDVDANTHAKTTTGKAENKFGIDLATASRLIKNIAVQPNIRLLGVDIHLGSPVNSVEPYRQALEKIAAFIRDNRSPRAALDYVNIGGGFGIVYRDQSVPSFKEYADAVVPFVKSAGCKLITEPGRSIVGNSAILLTRVTYVKDNGYKNFTIVDAGMNDLVRPAMYGAYHFCWPVRSAALPPSRLFDSPEADAYIHRENDDRDKPPSRAPDAGGMIMTDVVGPICESSDCFAHGIRLPEHHRGDLLALFSAGAYGSVMASNYNTRPRPAEILVDGGGAALIRRRETIDDLLQHETIQPA